MHLMQKMGWKQGEGLGIAKQGQLEPLALDVKTDRKGKWAKMAAILKSKMVTKLHFWA